MSKQDFENLDKIGMVARWRPVHRGQVVVLKVSEKAFGSGCMIPITRK